MSLRHPQVSLRDTIVMKLIALIDPRGAASTTYLRERVGEIVDDLTEHIITEWEKANGRS